MLSKAQIKHITALRTKKSRNEHSQFFVEGKKSIQELLKSTFETINLFYTPENTDYINELDFENAITVTPIEYSKISPQKQPEGILALVKIPAAQAFVFANKKYIALDQIRDPGNLGTIIRIADWFGVDELICSPDCVELYNPKVIQASMGSIFNVNVRYIDLASELESTALPKYAAMLQGESVYDAQALEEGILVIGNEANGISKDVLNLCSKQISIPQKGQAESLNAAMACGILTSYLFR